MDYASATSRDTVKIPPNVTFLPGLPRNRSAIASSGRCRID